MRRDVASFCDAPSLEAIGVMLGPACFSRSAASADDQFVIQIGFQASLLTLPRREHLGWRHVGLSRLAVADRRPPRQLRCQIQRAVPRRDRYRNIVLVILHAGTDLEIRKDTDIV